MQSRSLSANPYELLAIRSPLETKSTIILTYFVFNELDYPILTATMGQIYTREHFDVQHFTLPHKRLPKREWPSDREPSPYDPMYGFPNGRKPREMIATEAEMDSGKLDPPKRDYCAHRLLELRGCLKSNAPFPLRCTHELHAFHDCEWEDQVLRMKEWEREKRLRQRDYRKQLKAQKEAKEMD